MNSNILIEARRHEEIMEKTISGESRPAFHLSARVGWMNDPNGFSYYKGQYHLFYQYNPYRAQWGPMHWAHAVTQDFVHWRHLPAALAPDTLPDRDGCFSGSAVELPDGRHLLMYTGVVNERQPDNTNIEYQTQCVAIGDGENYEKYGGNPVISADDLPAGASVHDFRDPKIWQEPDGSYRCIIGSRPADGSGQILLYSSPDAIHWTFESVFASNRHRFGLMWECPDYFTLDGKQVLLTSPQDMLPEGFEYHNGNGTLCLIGHYDPETKTFVEESDQAVDYGIDYYAMQTVLTPDGRRVMIAWMQNWDALAIARRHTPWFGQMTLPREIRIKNGRLYQWPVRELEALRTNKTAYSNVEFTGGLTLNGICGVKTDITITLRPGDAENVYKKFAVRFRQKDAQHMAVSFRPYEGILKIDRKFSGSRRAIIHQRRCLVPGSGSGEITFRMILDQCSVEVFINGGAQTVTATMYIDPDADGISFFADGAVCMDIEKYDLEV